MTRVAILHPWNPYDSRFVGGIESYIKEMISFAPRSIDLTIICWKSNSATHPSEFTLEFIEMRKPKMVKVPKVLLFTLSILHFKLLSLKKFDVLITHRPELVYVLKKLFPSALIYLFLHTDQKLNIGSNSDSFWKRIPLIYKRMIPKCYALADGIYNLSRTSQHFVEMYNSNTRLLRASAADHFRCTENKKRNGVVWLGRLEAPKNPLLGVEVLNLFSSLGHSCTLIGNGSLLEDCLNSKSKDVAYLDFLSSIELAEILSRSEIVIMTSHFEGAPKGLVEALSSGCRVICNVESDPELLHLEFPERISIVNENSPNAFLDAMKRMKLGNVNVEELSVDGRIERLRASVAVPQLWRDLMEQTKQAKR